MRRRDASTSDHEGAGRVAAEDEEEDEGEDKMCIVCMVKPRATRFGCGHACCCFDCARTLKAMPEPQAVCPTCRAPITWIAKDGAWIAKDGRWFPRRETLTVPVAKQASYDSRLRRIKIRELLDEDRRGQQRAVLLHQISTAPDRDAALAALLESGLLRSAVELGLSDGEAVGHMIDNVRAGRFSAQHYADLWGPRVEAAERARRHNAGDAPRRQHGALLHPLAEAYIRSLLHKHISLLPVLHKTLLLVRVACDRLAFVLRPTPSGRGRRRCGRRRQQCCFSDHGLSPEGCKLGYRVLYPPYGRHTYMPAPWGYKILYAIVFASGFAFYSYWFVSRFLTFRNINQSDHCGLFATIS